MDGSLTGAFTGLTLRHTPAHLYRALLEASAFGVRWIVELLREHGVPVKKFVATGGLPHHNPLVVEVYADVLGAPIVVHPSKHGPALGAAILGALAAGAFPFARRRHPRDGRSEIRRPSSSRTAPTVRRLRTSSTAHYRRLARSRTSSRSSPAAISASANPAGVETPGLSPERMIRQVRHVHRSG